MRHFHQARTRSVPATHSLATRVGEPKRHAAAGRREGEGEQGFNATKISLDVVLLEYGGADAALAPGESQNF